MLVHFDGEGGRGRDDLLLGERKSEKVDTVESERERGREMLSCFETKREGEIEIC